ncbi:MAG: hypothetical protein WBW51_11580 [Methyloceanibacter sp.]
MREKRVWIKRYRRDELIELACIEQLLLRLVVPRGLLLRVEGLRCSEYENR